ncbi:hypothetical protein RHS01_06334 [Rhizoctonia solani]|uniref:ARID domain-containing protein n=1 Tax=Rhizoctonia solani TaxID=456999 RepID=A0A8H7I9P9_9AGAM|nr:hypothetical protein RHS01_06334 [Rhizoctonia solani]
MGDPLNNPFGQQNIYRHLQSQGLAMDNPAGVPQAPPSLAPAIPSMPGGVQDPNQAKLWKAIGDQYRRGPNAGGNPTQVSRISFAAMPMAGPFTSLFYSPSSLSFSLSPSLIQFPIPTPPVSHYHPPCPPPSHPVILRPSHCPKLGRQHRHTLDSLPRNLPVFATILTPDFRPQFLQNLAHMQPGQGGYRGNNTMALASGPQAGQPNLVQGNPTAQQQFLQQQSIQRLGLGLGQQQQQQQLGAAIQHPGLGNANHLNLTQGNNPALMSLMGMQGNAIGQLNNQIMNLRNPNVLEMQHRLDPGMNDQLQAIQRAQGGLNRPGVALIHKLDSLPIRDLEARVAAWRDNLPALENRVQELLNLANRQPEMMPAYSRSKQELEQNKISVYQVTRNPQSQAHRPVSDGSGAGPAGSSTRTGAGSESHDSDVRRALALLETMPGQVPGMTGWQQPGPSTTPQLPKDLPPVLRPPLFNPFPPQPNLDQANQVRAAMNQNGTPRQSVIPRDRAAFVQFMRMWFVQTGRTSDAIPKIGDKPLDLHQLYVEVETLGGLDKVGGAGLWRLVAVKMGYVTHDQNDPQLAQIAKVLADAYVALLVPFDNFCLERMRAPAIGMTPRLASGPGAYSGRRWDEPMANFQRILAFLQVSLKDWMPELPAQAKLLRASQMDVPEMQRQDGRLKRITAIQRFRPALMQYRATLMRQQELQRLSQQGQNNRDCAGPSQYQRREVLDSQRVQMNQTVVASHPFAVEFERTAALLREQHRILQSGQQHYIMSLEDVQTAQNALRAAIYNLKATYGNQRRSGGPQFGQQAQTQQQQMQQVQQHMLGQQPQQSQQAMAAMSLLNANGGLAGPQLGQPRPPSQPQYGESPPNGQASTQTGRACQHAFTAAAPTPQMESAPTPSSANEPATPKSPKNKNKATAGPSSIPAIKRTPTQAKKKPGKIDLPPPVISGFNQPVKRQRPSSPKRVKTEFESVVPIKTEYINDEPVESMENALMSLQEVAPNPNGDGIDPDILAQLSEILEGSANVAPLASSLAPSLDQPPDAGPKVEDVFDFSYYLNDNLGDDEALVAGTSGVDPLEADTPDLNTNKETPDSAADDIEHLGQKSPGKGEQLSAGEGGGKNPAGSRAPTLGEGFWEAFDDGKCLKARTSWWRCERLQLERPYRYERVLDWDYGHRGMISPFCVLCGHPPTPLHSCI